MLICFVYCKLLIFNFIGAERGFKKRLKTPQMIFGPDKNRDDTFQVFDSRFRVKCKQPCLPACRTGKPAGRHPFRPRSGETEAKCKYNHPPTRDRLIWRCAGKKKELGLIL
jgi:hypothetical protein